MYTQAINAPDAWILQEKVVYKFQQTQLARRIPHLKRQQAQPYTSIHEGSNNGRRAPDIVLLSLWPQATEQQILHYTVGYRTLYPTTKVVLLYNNATKFMGNDLNHNTALHELVECRSATASIHSNNNNQTVMLHLFGTSGAAGACTLLRRYRLRTGGALNVGAVIADTEPSPSISTFFTSSEPISSAFFTILLAFWITLQQYMWFWPSDLHTGQVHQDLNNPSLLPKEARKCFVFAQRGLMLTWMQHSLPKAKADDYSCSTEVNDEAEERRAYAIRRSSIDQKGRWSGDQERYWSGIEGVWDGR